MNLHSCLNAFRTGSPPQQNGGITVDPKRKKSPKDARNQRKNAKPQVKSLAREFSTDSEAKRGHNKSNDNLMPIVVPTSLPLQVRLSKRKQRPVTKADETSTDLMPVLVDERDAVMPRASFNGSGRG